VISHGILLSYVYICKAVPDEERSERRKKQKGEGKNKGRNIAFCLTLFGVCNRLIALLNKTTIAHISHFAVHEYV